MLAGQTRHATAAIISGSSPYDNKRENRNQRDPRHPFSVTVCLPISWQTQTNKQKEKIENLMRQKTTSGFFSLKKRIQSFHFSSPSDPLRP
jgi:hypothetical protein